MNIVPYSASAVYETAGAPLAEADEIWLACHGYGQLARHFIRRFDVLPPGCAVVAPQGLSRFYLDHATGRYEQVGASWITREERELDLSNMLSYLEAVWTVARSQARPDVRWKIMGFSQGVSAVLRWVAHSQIPAHEYLLWAGMPPAELAPEDLPEAPVTLVIGWQDELLKPERVDAAVALYQVLLPSVRIHWFEGGHEVNREVLAGLVQGK